MRSRARKSHLARDGGRYGTVTGSGTGRDREQGRALSVANPLTLASARSRLPIERSEMRDPTEVLRSLFRGLADDLHIEAAADDAGNVFGPHSPDDALSFGTDGAIQI
jgi:hypothetical protein